jgi:hypothetical protein
VENATNPDDCKVIGECNPCGGDGEGDSGVVFFTTEE